MMYFTVKGTYQKGVVELAEFPEGVDQANVLVVFLPDSRDGENPPAKLMTKGKFEGPGQSTEEDFRLAEWRGGEDEEDGP